MGHTKADPKLSEGARLERRATRAHLRSVLRQLETGVALSPMAVVRGILDWTLKRSQRYDEAPGGLGKLAILFAVGVTLAAPRLVHAQCSQASIPPAGQQALKQLAVQFAGELQSPDDNVRRVWAMRAAEQLAFTVSPEFGTKRADPGRPLSKDSVARIIGGRLCNWDLVNGSTRQLQFGNAADITGQTFVAVAPRNHLGATPPQPPAPSPQPPTCPPDQTATVTALRAALVSMTAERDRVYAQLQEWDKRLQASDAKLAAVGCRAWVPIGIPGVRIPARCEVTGR